MKPAVLTDLSAPPMRCPSSSTCTISDTRRSPKCTPYAFTLDQVESFVPESLETFSWQPVAAATKAQYAKLCEEHAILADIACFQSAHINHLTPRVLDIEVARKAMESAGMPVKASIEGPPKRTWPILLRQTSFLALEEQIQFKICEQGLGEGNLAPGSHKARFGEIEERGAAVTRKGRHLYDSLLEEANSKSIRLNASVIERESITSEVFRKFPDVWSDMRREGLVYCLYRRTSKTLKQAKELPLPAGVNQETVEILLRLGLIQVYPITYEDFLPFSAAGIFQSNLKAKTINSPSPGVPACPDQEGFEGSLGCQLISSDDLYLQIENASLEECAASLGILCAS